MSAKQIWLSLLVIFVVSSAIALAVPFVRGGGLSRADPAPAPSPSPSAHAILLVECGSVALCDLIIDDLLRRTPLTEADRTRAERAVLTVQRLVAEASESDCTPVGGDACALRYLPADPDELRDALAAAGHPDAVVRLAEAGDPAPARSVVIAVPIGPACLLGYHAAGSGPSQLQVGGQLPGGTCR